MTSLFRNESSYPKINAQRNLCGRTHYVDDDTLRGFKSKIISARDTHQGMLFAIVTSDAMDFENRSRGFRYVIFDIFGTVIERNPSSVDREYFRTSTAATAAMWRALDAIDAKAWTQAAIVKAEKRHADEMQRLRDELAKLEDTPPTADYVVTVRYRTNSGINAKDVTVRAKSGEEAITLASEKVRAMRGVTRIDGGEWLAKLKG